MESVDGLPTKICHTLYRHFAISHRPSSFPQSFLFSQAQPPRCACFVSAIINRENIPCDSDGVKGAKMTTLEKVRELLPAMSLGEKAQVLQWIARDIGGALPGIESTPNILGGEPCIVRTRIPVWLLVQARKLGSSEADILRAYPTLRAEDLTNAWAYYDAHKDEIEQQIAENEAE